MRSAIIKAQATFSEMINLKILQKLNKIDLLILIDLILMLLALCLINYTNIDLVIQDYFFDFHQKSWIVDKDEMIKKFIFYQFPKILLGLTIITLAVFSFLGFKKKSPFFTQNRHRFFLIFLGLCLIPLIAGNIKKVTNVYCPNQLEYYGGSKPYVKIFDHYPSGFYQEKKGKCFPAGHAVTGFSLLILFFALAKKTHRIYGLCAGLALGFIMGIYQMAKGVHFFGDTLISMLVCFLLAALIARIYECKFLVKNGDLEN